MKDLKIYSHTEEGDYVYFKHKGQVLALDHEDACIHVLYNDDITFVIFKDYVNQMIRCVIYNDGLDMDITMSQPEWIQTIGEDALDLTAEYLAGMFFAYYNIMEK